MQKNKKIIKAPFESYWGVFLTLGCSLKCEYCVQKITLAQQPVAQYPFKSGKDWVVALNALPGRRRRKGLFVVKKKKLSITGGEPTLHPDFVYILNNLDKDWRITVTTNFTTPFFEGEAMGLGQIKNRSRLKFNGSFHFLYTPVEKFIENTLKIKKAGINLHSLFIVGHPGHGQEIEKYKKMLLEIHPVVKVQRFFGYFHEELYPLPEARYDIAYEQQDGITNYQEYQRGFSQRRRQPIYCRMNKVLFAPDGSIYNCHYKLYTGHKDKLGNLFADDLDLSVPADFFLCQEYGFCNPCDSEGHSFRKPTGEEFNISQPA